MAHDTMCPLQIKDLKGMERGNLRKSLEMEDDDRDEEEGSSELMFDMQDIDSNHSKLRCVVLRSSPALLPLRDYVRAPAADFHITKTIRACLVLVESSL